MKIDIEKVLAEYGLKDGDKVAICGRKIIYKIVSDDNYQEGYYLLKEDNYRENYNLREDIDLLFKVNFEKVKEKVKVGDLKCYSALCEKCPLHSLNCDFYLIGNNLYKVFDNMLNKYPELEPLRKSFTKKLDEEVK